MQTQWLMKRAEQDGSRRTLWYTTSRMPPEIRGAHAHKTTCRRFMFADQVKPTKGVFEIIAAADRFADPVEVNVYGTLFPGISATDFDGHPRVRYCGELPHDQVIGAMEKHDALLLPTYHFGEGYPGVVIEAYIAGIPVICSRWQSIPEIVDETSGLLVEPRNAEALYAAMKLLVDDPALYGRLQAGARAKRQAFSAPDWADYFATICMHAADRKLDRLAVRRPAKFLEAVHRVAADEETA